MASRIKIADAPSGEDTASDGTEKIPVSGSKYMLVSTIAAYIRTLVQTLTNKTINLASNTLTGTTAEFNTALSDGNFAVNVFKTLAVSGQSDVVADSDTDTLTLAAGSNVTITTNASTDTVTFAASGGNAFGTVAVSGQSDVVADAAPDTLTLAAGSNVTITTNASTDTVTIAASGGNAFGTIAVSGQSDVVADAAPDTLTLAAGSGVTLTTNAGTDTVTIAASGGAFALNTNTTPVGNVGAGEDNLITYDVPANTLDTNAQFIHYIMGGTFAASINNKRIKVKLGATTLFDTGVLAITAAGDWNLEGYIIRTGAATQRCLLEFESSQAALLATADYVDATEDLTTQLTLKATGEATDNDDIIQKFLIVEKGGGSGGVAGPSSATDNAVARFDGTTGKLIQNSSATVDDNGTVNIPTGQTYNINGSNHTHTSNTPTGFLFGLTLSNNATDPTNDIDIATGKCRDSTDAQDLTLASTLVKRLDASWVTGTNQGGLSSSLTISNTTYHVFVIRIAGVDDIGFDTSVTAANLITDHSATHFRRIGSIVRASAAIKTFQQDGDEFRWKVPVADISAANPGTAAVTRTLTVPLGIRIQLIAGVASYGGGAAADNAQAIFISDLSITDTAPTSAAFSIVSYNSAAVQNQKGAIVYVYTNTSGQVRSRLQASATNTTFVMSTLGWIDGRGRT